MKFVALLITLFCLSLNESQAVQLHPKRLAQADPKAETDAEKEEQDKLDKFKEKAGEHLDTAKEKTTEAWNKAKDSEHVQKIAERTGLAAGTIVAIALGVLVGIPACIICYCCYCKKGKKEMG